MTRFFSNVLKYTIAVFWFLVAYVSFSLKINKKSNERVKCYVCDPCVFIFCNSNLIFFHFWFTFHLELNTANWNKWVLKFKQPICDVLKSTKLFPNFRMQWLHQTMRNCRSFHFKLEFGIRFASLQLWQLSIELLLGIWNGLRPSQMFTFCFELTNGKVCIINWFPFGFKVVPAAGSTNDIRKFAWKADTIIYFIWLSMCVCVDVSARLFIYF